MNKKEVIKSLKNAISLLRYLIPYSIEKEEKRHDVKVLEEFLTFIKNAKQ